MLVCPHALDANFNHSLDFALRPGGLCSGEEIMTRELEGKTALVTGGTSGIGRETAVLFAEAGAKVVIAGRREAEGNETVELVRAAGGDALFVKTDVSKASEVEMPGQKSGREIWPLGCGLQ